MEKLINLMVFDAKIEIYFFGLALLFLFGDFFYGCGRIKIISPPDWVNGESVDYPREEYLTGVGFGDTRESAEKKAYAALSQIFQANIQSQSREWEEFLQSSGQNQIDKNPVVQRKIKIDQLTQVSTEKVLENISIAEVWEDQQKKKFFVLAIINRGHSVQILMEKIRDLDKKALELLNNVQNLEQIQNPKGLESKLQIVQNLHGALRTVLVRHGLNADLQIIEPFGRGMESPFSLEKISLRLRKFLEQDLDVVLEVSGPFQREIRMAFVRSLSQEGFPFIENQYREDVESLLIKVEFSLFPLTLQAQPFFNWQVSAILKEKSSGRVFGSLNRNGREGHVNKKEAEARAVRFAQRVIIKEIGPEISQRIFGDEKNLF